MSIAHFSIFSAVFHIRRFFLLKSNLYSVLDTASRAISDSSGNNISSTYATKNQAIATIVAPTTKTYAVAGSRNTFKLNGTLADSTTYSIDTDIPAVWDANGHLVSPAGWTFYITNGAYNS